MSQPLKDIAQNLIDANKKVQLIYAFNGTGKTRLSREFRENVDPKEQRTHDTKIKLMYYNAFTEDLFYWDNDLPADTDRKLHVQPNNFTDLALTFLKDENQDGNIITNFQSYTTNKITPSFNENFTEIRFSYLGGGDNSEPNIKISKGEESNFIWCVFFSLIEQIIKILNELKEDRSSDKFDELEYIFIDDPVSSLDDNHLIDLAVDLSILIKKAKPTNVKFIVSTHNPLFYNVLYNELNREKNTRKYRLQKLNDGEYLLEDSNDSPFSYHIFLLEELKSATNSRNIHKYHFNLLRNVLEKTSTYLGFNHWEDLIPMYVDTEETPVAIRLINLYSHSKHSGDEMAVIQEMEKDIFIKVFNNLLIKHSFKLQNIEIPVVEQKVETPHLQDV
ncbi:AAA family ATPase [Pedobacter sp.]